MKKKEEISKIIDSFRGKIIQASVKIDSAVGGILAQHYTRSDESFKDFMLTINPALSFEKKIRIMEIILKNNYAGIYKKYKKTIEMLDELRIIRNGIVHGFAGYPKNAKNSDVICFMMLKNGNVKLRDLTTKDRGKVLNSIDFIKKDLNELEKIIMEKPQSGFRP